MFASVINLCFSLAAVGALLIVHGRRARQRLGDRWCRACRSILPAERLAEAKCGSCGGDLSAIVAVGVGRRRRRPGLIALGSLLLWAALSVVLARGIDWLEAVDWQVHKPQFVLLSEARSTDAAASLSAINELLRREQAGLLSSDRRSELIDLILGRVLPTDAQTTIRWLPLVEQEWLAGRLSREHSLQLAKYVTSLAGLVHSRDALRQGTFIRFTLNPSQRERLAESTIFVKIEPLEVTLDGEPVASEIDESDGPAVIAPGMQHGGGMRVQFPLIASPGDHTLDSAWKVEFEVSGYPETAMTWIEKHSQEITVAPPDDRSREIRIDVESSQAMRAATRVDLVGVRGLHPDTGEDVIIGVIDPQPAELQFEPDYEVWYGGELVQQSTQGRMLFVCIPLGNRTRDASLRILMRSRAVRVPDFVSPRFKPDLRAIWYGPAILIEPEPVEWFDSLDDPRIAETIRRRRWESVIRRLQAPVVTERKGSHWTDPEGWDER